MRQMEQMSTPQSGTVADTSLPCAPCEVRPVQSGPNCYLVAHSTLPWGRGEIQRTSTGDPPHWEGVVQQQDLHLRDTSQTEHLIQTECLIHQHIADTQCHERSAPNCTTQQETQCWTPLTCVQTADQHVLNGWTPAQSLQTVAQGSEGLWAFVQVQLKGPDSSALAQQARHANQLRRDVQYTFTRIQFTTTQNCSDPLTFYRMIIAGRHTHKLYKYT